MSQGVQVTSSSLQKAGDVENPGRRNVTGAEGQPGAPLDRPRSVFDLSHSPLSICLPDLIQRGILASREMIHFPLIWGVPCLALHGHWVFAYCCFACFLLVLVEVKHGVLDMLHSAASALTLQ